MSGEGLQFRRIVDLVYRVRRIFRIGTIGHASDLYQSIKLGTVNVLQLSERGMHSPQPVVLAGVFVLVVGSAGSAVWTGPEQGHGFEVQRRIIRPRGRVIRLGERIGTGGVRWRILRRVDEEAEVVLIQQVNRQGRGLGRRSAGHFTAGVRETEMVQHVGFGGKLRAEWEGVVSGSELVGVVGGAGHPVWSEFRSGVGGIIFHGNCGFESENTIEVIYCKVRRQVVRGAGYAVGSIEVEAGLSGEGLQIRRIVDLVYRVRRIGLRHYRQRGLHAIVIDAIVKETACKVLGNVKDKLITRWRTVQG